MRTKHKLVGSFFAATGLALGGFAVTAPGASAGTPDDCPSEYICAWTDENFEGHMGYDADNSGDWHPEIDNEDESWANYGVGDISDVIIYTDQHFDGDTWCLDQGEEVASYPKFANRGSSHEWVDFC